MAREVLQRGLRGRRLQRGVALLRRRARSPSARRRCWRCASATSANWDGSCTYPRVRGARLRAAADAGRELRHHQCRLSRDRHAAHGEGLPLLVDRHHARHHAVGGRARLAGQPRQGRLLRSRRAGRPTRRPASTRKLCTFTLEQMAYPVSGEAIIADGEVVGFTTSANFGHTIGKPIAYGYLPVELADRTRLRDRGLRRADPRHPPRPAPLYDPKNAAAQGDELTSRRPSPASRCSGDRRLRHHDHAPRRA